MKDQSSQQKMQELDYGKLKSRRAIQNLDREMEFTRTHIKYKNALPYIREAECLKVQSRMILTPIEKGDMFAGRCDRMFVGIDPERGDVDEPAYFYQKHFLQEQLEYPFISAEIKEDIQFLIEYWQKNATYYKCRAAFPGHLNRDMPSDDYYSSRQVSFPMFGMGGPCLDFEKLIKLGIPGLHDLVQQRKIRAKKASETNLSFYDAMLTALEIFRENAATYAKNSRKMAEKTRDKKLQKQYSEIHTNLLHIIDHKPETYHQGLQLVWLYSLLSSIKNYGRMDLYMGNLLADNLDNGKLSWPEALEITVGFWKMIVARGDNFNNRIIIGGKGRENEKNADRFTFLALETQKIVNEAIPQLSVRWYEGMKKEIWDKSFEVLASGSTMPIIYNDDANIPGIMKAMEVPYEEAKQYAFYGCGEFLIDHKAIASPDAAINVLKMLDVTLRNGIDSFTGERQGLAMSHLKDFTSFEQLKAAFARQVAYQMSMLADAQATIYKVTSQEASFPFISLLYDDCIERGKPLLAGGVKYLSGTVESFGNNSAADALYAIKTLVYDKKIMTPEQMMACLDNNFEGFEKERKMMKNLPKYGNDHEGADELSLWVNEICCQAAIQQKDYTCLHSFLVVMINNGDSVLHGKTTAASADGRKAGEPLSNGNQPSVGNDRNGVTALLNSMSKLNPEMHAGVTNNIKFNRATLLENPAQIKALIKSFFQNGGTQIMSTSIHKGELEKALKEPENYRHIFVRVGGYSEIFVDLPADIQLEVLNRTFY